MIFYFILFLCVGIAIGYFIGHIRISLIKKKIELELKQKIELELNKGTGRFGVIEVKGNYSRILGYVEIEEISSAGSLTKIKIIKITSSDPSNIGMLESRYQDWVETSQITWYSNDSQVIRNNKLKSLLNTEN